MMRLMVKNEIEVPSSWKVMLSKMSKYVSDCIGDFGEVVVFGDDDEGKILDLQGGIINHYAYVLGMMSILLNERYVVDFNGETLYWLFTSPELDNAKRINEYVSPLSSCYKEGGNTILRSSNHEVIMGIDHAALGFGSIAAHGHADALSFQLYFEGKPVFIDPGTYVYHCDLKSRNEFRKTKNHNTVCIGDKDQSEMLGAFLWGRKARAELLSCEQKGDAVKVVMQHDGYSPVIHKRTIKFDGHKRVSINDSLSIPSKAISTFILAEDIRPEINSETIALYRGLNTIATLRFKSGIPKVSVYDISCEYGLKRKTYGIAIAFETDCKVEIGLM